jgi:monoamine oxidase
VIEPNLECIILIRERGVYMKIAIIGAGLAGLTAAYRLHQAGLNVELFEAQNRVGGRVLTIPLKNYLGETSLVELGGQGITDGGLASHFLTLAQEFSLKSAQKLIYLNSLVYFENNYHDFFKSLQESPNTLDNLHAFSQQAESIGNLIDLLFKHNPIARQALITRMTAYEGVDAYQQSIYHNIETLEYTLQGGLAKFHEVHSHKTGEILTSTLKDGNASICLKMAEVLSHKIHFNKILAKISLSNNLFDLNFEDNTHYTYDFVILAIPAATYKNIDLSGSGIEKNKLAVIQKIMYGQNSKIAIPFNLTQRKNNQLDNFRSVMTKNTVSFFNFDQMIPLIYTTKSVPNIKELCEITANGLGLENQSYDNFVMHSWAEDVYALGSYAAYSNTVSKELDKKISFNNTEYKDLFSPVIGKLFFAGEHTTILDCIGTMEAAVESGERIANAISLAVVEK